MVNGASWEGKREAMGQLHRPANKWPGAHRSLSDVPSSGFQVLGELLRLDREDDARQPKVDDHCVVPQEWEHCLHIRHVL